MHLQLSFPVNAHTDAPAYRVHDGTTITNPPKNAVSCPTDQLSMPPTACTSLLNAGCFLTTVSRMIGTHTTARSKYRPRSTKP